MNIVEQNISGVLELCRSHHVKNMFKISSKVNKLKKWKI